MDGDSKQRQDQGIGCDHPASYRFCDLPARYSIQNQ